MKALHYRKLLRDSATQRFQTLYLLDLCRTTLQKPWTIFSKCLLTISNYEIHKMKLQQARKINAENLIDDDAEALKLRILNNKLKSHEFVENGKLI